MQVQDNISLAENDIKNQANSLTNISGTLSTVALSNENFDIIDLNDDKNDDTIDDVEGKSLSIVREENNLEHSSSTTCDPFNFTSVVSDPFAENSTFRRRMSLPVSQTLDTKVERRRLSLAIENRSEQEEAICSIGSAAYKQASMLHFDRSNRTRSLNRQKIDELVENNAERVDQGPLTLLKMIIFEKTKTPQPFEQVIEEDQVSYEAHLNTIVEPYQPAMLYWIVSNAGLYYFSDLPETSEFYGTIPLSSIFRIQITDFSILLHLTDGTFALETASKRVLLAIENSRRSYFHETRITYPVGSSFEDHYQITAHFGQGGNSFIKLAKKCNSNEIYVAKFIEKSKVRILKHKDLPFEIDLLSKINHPAIVHVYEYFVLESHFVMMMKLHGKGVDLFDYIERERYIPEPAAKFMFRQIIEAVEFLHEIGISHGDIKDENVILDEKTLIVKLIDFGSASPCDKNQSSKIFCGTIRNSAPEIFGDKYFDLFLQDVWSLGLMLFIMVFGEEPFEENDEEKNLLFPELNKYAPIPSPELLDCIGMMLMKNPENRSSTEEILSHSWLSNE